MKTKKKDTSVYRLVIPLLLISPFWFINITEKYLSTFIVILIFVLGSISVGGARDLVLRE